MAPYLEKAQRHFARYSNALTAGLIKRERPFPPPFRMPDKTPKRPARIGREGVGKCL
jgi:hypothetical protein